MTANNNVTTVNDGAKCSNPGLPSSTTKAPRVKCSESRKIRKPLMEKRRRARINHSLNELKRILLEANGAPSRKEGNRPAKLEKADILELTVRHLQNLHRQHKSHQNVSSTSNSDSDDESTCSLGRQSGPLSPQGTTRSLSPNNLDTVRTSPFINGFAQCIRLVTSSLRTGKPNEINRKRLEDQLHSHLADLSQGQTYKEASSPAGANVDTWSSIDRENSRGILMDADDNVTHPGFDERQINSPILIGDIKGKGNTRTYLLPTRMSNGDLAFVLKCSGEDNKSTWLPVDMTMDPRLDGVHYVKTESVSPHSYIDNHDDIHGPRVIWRPW